MITSVRDLLAPTGGMGTVTAIDELRFTSLAAAGATVAVYMRTCLTPNTCTGAWNGPYASGATPALLPGRYAQFLFAISTNTDRDTYLDRFELDYIVQ